MWPSLKPSQRVAVAGIVAPQSLGAGDSLETGWVDFQTFLNLMAAINVGAMTATGLVDAKVTQAQDDSGTNEKAIDNVDGGAALAITQLTYATGPDTVQLINVRQDEIDVAGGFRFVRLTLTATTEAVLISAMLLGFDCALGDASAQNPAAVTQVVG